MFTINGNYKYVIDYYGNDKQIEKAIEELRELRLELWRALRGNADKERILDEISDVYNVLAQVEMIYEIESGEIVRRMQKKMTRQLERIAAEKAP
jgi:uncharacterized protein YabN with tetrapyrrole methylase and pyrophosphatase domain